MWRLAWVASVLAAVICGCSMSTHPHTPAPAPVPVPEGTIQEGIASWYGPGFHGNPTSSGEIYDQNDLTAAHQTLPLGTRVAVTNLTNGRSVEVRINDRGPFVDNRVLDLSYAAARNLDMIGPGTAPVRIQVLGPDATISAATYAVQVGAFANRSNAERLHAALRQRFSNVYISQLDSGAMRYYRVRLGRFSGREQAERQAHQVAALGLPAVIVEDGATRN